MKSKIIVVQSILILALLIIIGVLSIQNGKNSKAEVLYLEYGDTFSAIEIYGTTGEKVDKLAPDQSKKATVVFYVRLMNVPVALGLWRILRGSNLSLEKI